MKYRFDFLSRESSSSFWLQGRKCADLQHTSKENVFRCELTKMRLSKAAGNKTLPLHLDPCLWRSATVVEYCNTISPLLLLTCEACIFEAEHNYLKLSVYSSHQLLHYMQLPMICLPSDCFMNCVVLTCLACHFLPSPDFRWLFILSILCVTEHCLT